MLDLTVTQLNLIVRQYLNEKIASYIIYRLYNADIINWKKNRKWFSYY